MTAARLARTRTRPVPDEGGIVDLLGARVG